MEPLNDIIFSYKRKQDFFIWTTKYWWP